MSLIRLPLAVRTEQDDAESGSPPPSRCLRIALVNMPWARIHAPSIQCGLLQSIARRAGHECDSHYLNIEFASFFGSKAYDAIANIASERLHLMGERLFSYVAFGEVTTDDQYFGEYPEVKSIWDELTGKGLDDLTEMRRRTLPDWIAACAAKPVWGEYDVIGFTSTFMQNTASLALGKMIKKFHPGVTLVYGGANFDGDMGVEYAKKLPWLDYVVAGEGDIVFPALLNNIADGTDTPLPGVLRYAATHLPPAADAERPQVLDQLPTPDYRDYFTWLERFDRTRLLGRAPVQLPVEFSRGCWWGQKHHCTFCGLNALGMAYRSKSGSRAFTELTALLRDYPVVHVDTVDNILDMGYFSSLCAQLAEAHWDVNLFFEAKANLTREQLATLSRAGILRIQPGIESLSTHVLKLMRKGASKLINIRFLKWAAYYKIDVSWNILAGFPGETEEDYAEQLRLLPLLHHLQPPGGCGRIWLERFSPYFTDPSFPISEVRPRASYGHVYPDSLDHEKIAYFFDYEVSGTCSHETVAALNAAVSVWQTRFSEARPSLVYQRLPGKLTLIDRRTDQPKRAVLAGWKAEAYESCGDAPRGAAAVSRQLAAGDMSVSEDEVAAFLEQCCRAGVMVSDDGKYLGLALPENPGW
ncbi:RiPP maturation radical SAM C-methyltransferase [Streptomyces lydicus]|uniref:RiPP maturation radical SAM C-methyltransferase n=1 Tax=Streptomyces lydicus TaxID=47763 RepID=UPI0010102D84|nr:RiPP maturation radical SAM C-methyltransferase [Streptomyces lydicus]MCZ1006022.1 RiPP maturation radical SAM C-methyltransferase [Streptomyces lydicus]